MLKARSVIIRDPNDDPPEWQAQIDRMRLAFAEVLRESGAPPVFRFPPVRTRLVGELGLVRDRVGVNERGRVAIDRLRAAALEGDPNEPDFRQFAHAIAGYQYIQFSSSLAEMGLEIERVTARGGAA